MGKIACGVAALAGITFGGALHAWLIAGAAIDRLQQQGLNTLYFGVKPPGETLGGLLFLALLGCAVPVVLILLLAASALAERRMYGVGSGSRWGLASVARLLTWVFLGATIAAGVNLHLVDSSYHDAAATGEWYSAATIAVGLPAMRDFTLRYVGSLAALLIGSALVALLARRPHDPSQESVMHQR